MDGVLLIDKPVGPTSFDVVRRIRKLAKIRRVGHAGTLDPLASGLLIACLGQGTKLVPYLMNGEKQYRVTVALGKETETLDAEGEVIREAPVPSLTKELIEAIAERFIGIVPQVPPRYSAIKRGGEALYKMARRGEEMVLEPREVRIDAIEVAAVGSSAFTLIVRCGKGTYIRSLARDMAAALGTAGHVAMLRREASSGFDVTRASPLSLLDNPEWGMERALIALPEAIPAMPRLVVSDCDAKAIVNGQVLPPGTRLSNGQKGGDHVAVLNEQGCLLSIAVCLENGGVKPVRGFSV